MIGGKSMFWARMSFRLSDYEFKAADIDGFGENWPIAYADLAPYYSQVEADFPRGGPQGRLAQLPDGEFHRGSIARQREPSRRLPAAAKRASIGSPRCAAHRTRTASPVPSTCCCRMRWKPEISLSFRTPSSARSRSKEHRAGQRRAFRRPAFAPRNAREGAVGGARRIVSRKHAHPAEFEDRQFQRRARPLPARSDLHVAAWWHLFRKRGTERRRGTDGRRRLHPAIPQSQERQRSAISSAATRSIFSTGGTPDPKLFPRLRARNCRKGSTAIAARRLRHSWAKCCRAMKTTSASTRT